MRMKGCMYDKAVYKKNSRGDEVKGNNRIMLREEQAVRNVLTECLKKWMNGENSGEAIVCELEWWKGVSAVWNKKG